MHLKHLTASDYKTMPWKNGGGTTTELMVEPHGAGTGYDWRLSIAAVGQSGPFSDFAGYDRTIMLIEGAGFTLEFDSADKKILNHRFEPFAFAGEWRTDCKLIDGPIRDFNLIARKGTPAVLEALHLARGPSQVAAAETVIIHLFQGEVDACGESLGAGDTLRIDQQGGPIVLQAREPAMAALIRIGG